RDRWSGRSGLLRREGGHSARVLAADNDAVLRSLCPTLQPDGSGGVRQTLGSSARYQLAAIHGAREQSPGSSSSGRRDQPSLSTGLGTFGSEPDRSSGASSLPSTSAR